MNFIVDENQRLITAQAHLDLIEDIQRDINRNTKYYSDPALYNVPEFWTIANGKGDCEDYALAKRQRLLKAGFPLKVLALATCWTETNEYHAVLIVHTASNDLVLDNRYTPVKNLNRLPYRWHKLQMPAENSWRFVTS